MIEEVLITLYQSWPYIGISVIIFAYIFDREQMDIELDGVAKFIAAMTIIMCIKLCIWNGNFVPTGIRGVELHNFLFVFLEDAFFVMLPHYICRRISFKIPKFIIWTLFSGLFMYGHMYQGIVWASITFFYPYFISYNYSKKTTFATVMACHFLFDCFSLLLPKINNILSLVR